MTVKRHPSFGKALWVPVLTAASVNPTLGAASVQDGRYWRDEDHVEGWGLVLFGTSGTAAGTGNYSVSLPVATEAATPANSPVGIGIMRRASDGLLINFVLVAPGGAGTTVLMLSDIAAGNAALITQASPFASTVQTQFAYQFGYGA